MKKILIALSLLASTQVFAKARIQNEDVKSVSDIESAVLTTTGNLTATSNCIASPASTTGLATGQYAYDTTTPANIPASTTISGLPGSCSSGQIQLSNAAAGSGTGDIITFGGQPSQLINDTKIWVSSVTPAQQLSSAISTGVIGGGAGGSKNYLTTYKSNTGNGNFEFGSTSGWSLFNTTMSGVLPLGGVTATASSITTFAATTTNAIGGTYSLNTASSGAWSAGQGFISSAFSIDSEDQAKIMTIKAYYSVQSGASNLNFSGSSSNTFAVYVYDVTNSAWIQPAGVYNLVQNSGSGYITGTFQTTSNSTQYRLAILAVNASGGAASVNWDDFSVGPQTAPLAPAVGDWVSYTPTGTWNTNSTYTGQYRRVGDSAEIKGRVVLTGAPNNTVLTFNLPSGLVIDFTKLSDTGGGIQSVIGLAKAKSAGGGPYDMQMRINSNTSVQPIVTGTSAVEVNNVDQTHPATFASGDSVEYTIWVPIIGWSSNSSASSDTDTRVVAMQLAQAAPTATITSTPSLLKFTGGVAQDTHGAFSTSTGLYTCPVSGYYRVSAGVVVSGTFIAGNSVSVYVAKNSTVGIAGSQTSVASAASENALVSFTIQCNAGDTLAPYVASTSTSPTVSSNVNLNYFTVERLSGPAVVVATESVNADYGNTALTSITSSFTQMQFNTKNFDSHNAFASNNYTCPVSGKYLMSAVISTTNLTLSISQEMSVALYHNGSAFATMQVNGNGSSAGGGNTYSGSLARLVSCAAGDTLAVYAQSSVTTTTNGVAAYNYFSVQRVGN